MKRTEYNLKYVKKCGQDLGIEFGNAQHKLKKLYMFHLIKKLGENICYRCKQEISDSDDFQLDHVIDWRETREREAKPESFWDLNNIKHSHEWCNCGQATKGTGRYKYVGVSIFEDKRKEKVYIKIRSTISINRQKLTLGYFTNQEEAAVAYDIAIVHLRKGAGILNFEYLRDQYKTYMSQNFKPEENIFYKRGPIQSITSHFLHLVKVDQTAN